MFYPISVSLIVSSSYFLQLKASKSVYLIRGYTTPMIDYHYLTITPG
jgi:hypothetical protein